MLLEVLAAPCFMASVSEEEIQLDWVRAFFGMLFEVYPEIPLPILLASKESTVVALRSYWFCLSNTPGDSLAFTPAETEPERRQELPERAWYLLEYASC